MLLHDVEILKLWKDTDDATREHIPSDEAMVFKQGKEFFVSCQRSLGRPRTEPFPKPDVQIRFAFAEATRDLQTVR